MNLRDLEYIVAVAKHQHFGKAAEQCFVSQPSLSMQIKKVEDELGSLIFERKGKQVLVTNFGKSILPIAKRMLESAAEIKQAGKLAQNGPLQLRLGVIPTIGPYLLPKVFAKLNQAYPDAQISWREAQTHQLVEWLEQGECDAAILALPYDMNLAVKECFVEPFYLAVAKSHPLAQRKQVSRKDLQQQKLILLEEGHCLRDHALEACALADSAQDQAFRSTSLETLKHLVANGDGVTLVPAMACSKKDDLVYIPFKEKSVARSIGLVYRATHPLKTVIEELVNVLQLH